MCKIQSVEPVRTAPISVLWTVNILCHTIQHKAVLIIFPLNLQTITITRMLSSRGEGESVNSLVVINRNRNRQSPRNTEANMTSYHVQYHKVFSAAAQVYVPLVLSQLQLPADDKLRFVVTQAPHPSTQIHMHAYTSQ